MATLGMDVGSKGLGSPHSEVLKKGCPLKTLHGHEDYQRIVGGSHMQEFQQLGSFFGNPYNKNVQC